MNDGKEHVVFNAREDLERTRYLESLPAQSVHAVTSASHTGSSLMETFAIDESRTYPKGNGAGVDPQNSTPLQGGSADSTPPKTPKKRKKKKCMPAINPEGGASQGG